MRKPREQLTLFSAVLDASEPAEELAPIVHTNGSRPPRAKKANTEDLPLLKPPSITGTPASQSFTDFFLEHNRVPMIQDERKPWTYQGWLMWYRLICEEKRPDLVPPRWSYWFETMDRGKLLDAPIPRIEFSGDESERTAPAACCCMLLTFP